MEKPHSLVPFKTAQLYVGYSIPWPIYDSNGKLLLAANSVIQNETQLQALIQKGRIPDGPHSKMAGSQSQTLPNAADYSAKAGMARERKEEESVKEETNIEMDDVQWNVGEVLQLQLSHNLNIRYTTKLIGYIKNQSVLISNPMREGKAEYLPEGQNLIVRAFPGKNVYAFLATVTKTIHIPHLYLHLSYPKQISRATIRRSSRVSVNIVAAVSLGQLEEPLTAILNDLSIGGTAGIVHGKTGNKGDTGKVKFKLRVADEDYFLNLRFVLCSVDSMDTANNYKYGMQFVELNNNEKLILSAFFYQKSVESSLT